MTFSVVRLRLRRENLYHLCGLGLYCDAERHRKVVSGTGVGICACVNENPHYLCCLGLYCEAERCFIEVKGVFGTGVGVCACVEENLYHLCGLGLYCDAERCFIEAKVVAVLDVQVIRA